MIRRSLSHAFRGDSGDRVGSAEPD